VLSKVIKARYIFEFDIVGYFDNVPVMPVLRWLESKGAITRKYADVIHK